MERKVVALLPMKGHSERVSNKNMRDFGGRPLYHAVMQTLLKCKNIEKVIINTDSDIIKNDALANFERVEIIGRPVEIQGDFVPMNNVIGYDLSKTDRTHFMQTHSTNPNVKPETFDKAIDFYFDNLDKYDSVFSVTRLQTRLYWADGSPVNHNPAELLRTQDLPPVFEENSNFFVFSQKSFADSGGKRIGIKPVMYEMNKLEAMDIDEPEDFELAELLYLKRQPR